MDDVIPQGQTVTPVATSPLKSDATLDYNPTPVTQQEPTLDFNPKLKTIPSEAIPTRAGKYDFSLGDASPGVQTLTAQLQNGDDDGIRRLQLQKNALDFQNAKLGIVQNLIKNSPNGVDPDGVDFINSMNKQDFEEVSHSSNVMETSYAKRYIQTIAQRDPNQSFAKTEMQSPEVANQKLDVGEFAVTRNEIVHTALDSLEQQKKEQGWGGYIGDIAGADLLPLAAVRLMNLVKSPSITSLIPGKNLQEQINYLHTLDPDQFETEFNKALNSTDNLELKQQFATAVLQQSDSDTVLATLGNIADVGTLFETGFAAGAKLAAKGIAKKTVAKTMSLGIHDYSPGEAAESLDSLIKSGVSASKDRGLDIVKLAGQTGNFKTAAVLNSIRATDDTIPMADEELIRQKALSINGGGNRWFTGNGANLARQNVDDFLDVSKSTDTLAEEFFGGPSVDRLSPEQRIDIRQELYNRTIASNNKSIQGAVLDVDAHGDPIIARLNDYDNRLQAGKPLSDADLAAHSDLADRVFNKKVTTAKFSSQLAENSPANIDTISITIGSKNGELFPNKASAVKFAKDNLSQHKLDLSGKPGSNLYPVQGKYALKLFVDAPDTLDNFKNISIPVGDKFSEDFFNGVFKGFFGKVRNQANVLGNANMKARLTVAHGNQRLYQLFQKIVEPISKLSKAERKRLGEILMQNRDFVDRATGERGQFFQSQGDFEDAYRTKWGALPSPKEITAYYSYIQANHVDGMVRNTGWLRDKVRLGLKQWSDSHSFDTPTDPVTSKKWKPLNFEGKQVYSLPEDDHNTRIAIRDSDTGKLTIVSKKYMNSSQKLLFKREMANGARIIQHSEGKLLISTEGKEVTVSHYVSGSAKESRISVNGPWKDGGHVLYQHPNFIKQPKANGEYYAGDVAVATAPNDRIAIERAKAYETARIKMVRGDSDLDDFVSKNIGNGMTGQSFQDIFAGQRLANGVEREGLDKHQPFVWTRSGERTVDRHKDISLKLKDNPYSLIDQDRHFAGERDAGNIPALIEERGVRQIHEDGSLIDPYKTMTDAAKSMTDVKLKRDYILKSANQWAQQFNDILNRENDATSGKGALQTLYNDNRNKYLPHVDKVLLNNAENARKSILRFAGSLSGEERAFETLNAKLGEIAYRALGDKKYNALTNTLERWLGPVSKNPARVARSIAADLKIGLFSPTQLFMQAQTAINVFAISPKAAMKGLPAFYPMRAIMHNENMWPHSLSVAVKFGWQESHFREMMESFTKSGWGRINGDLAILDDISSPNLFRSGKDKLIDAGRQFFVEGERIHRLGGYATGYQEWRMANPTAVFDRAAQQQVLARADTMTAHMSAANNAVWQKGLLAIPAQFLNYQARIMENYFGKTLTTAEKARLFASQAAAYGIPTAVGGAIGIWPMQKSVKAYLIDNNIPHDDAVVSSVLNGIPQVALRLITGSDFDVGERFGQGGTDLGYEYLRGDKSAWDLATGPSGSVLGDILSTSIPFFGALMDIGNDDPKSKYTMDVETLNRVVENISSVNSAVKLWHAMNTGRWMSKYNIAQDEVTPFQAIFMALTGAQLSEINEAYITKGILQDRKTLSDQASKTVADYYRRGFMEDDDKQRAEYFRIGTAWAISGGLTPQEIQQVKMNVLAQTATTAKDSIAQRLTKDSFKRSLIQDDNQ